MRELEFATLQKVNATRIQSMCVHPMEQKLLVLSGDKNGALGRYYFLNNLFNVIPKIFLSFSKPFFIPTLCTRLLVAWTFLSVGQVFCTVSIKLCYDIVVYNCHTGRTDWFPWHLHHRWQSDVNFEIIYTRHKLLLCFSSSNSKIFHKYKAIISVIAWYIKLQKVEVWTTVIHRNYQYTLNIK